MYHSVTTVQPVGIPLGPVVQLSIFAFLTNVPLEATPFNQDEVQSLAEISVARHLMWFRLVQPSNIPQ